MKAKRIEFWTVFPYGDHEQICSKHRTSGAAERAATRCEGRGGSVHRVLKVEEIPRMPKVKKQAIWLGLDSDQEVFVTQRLKEIQAKAGSHFVDGKFVTLFPVRFEFQSDEGAYPDAMLYNFRKGDTPEQALEGLKCMIRHLETKLSKRQNEIDVFIATCKAQNLEFIPAQVATSKVGKHLDITN